MPHRAGYGGSHAGRPPAARPPTPAVHSAASRSTAVWAVVITGLALFMASLDNLVVSTALPVIRVHLHAGLSGLEWTVNAYTLTFAVLLLTAAAMGERFGRRRIFVAGIALFTASSAAAALAPSIGVLIAARALQGAGGAMIMPLSLTLAERGGPTRAPQRRPRHLGRHRRDGRGHRPAGRRGGHQRLGLAVHLLAQRAGRDRPRPAGPVAPGRVAWSVPPRSTWPGSAW